MPGLGRAYLAGVRSTLAEKVWRRGYDATLNQMAPSSAEETSAKFDSSD